MQYVLLLTCAHCFSTISPPINTDPIDHVLLNRPIFLQFDHNSTLLAADPSPDGTISVSATFSSESSTTEPPFQNSSEMDALISQTNQVSLTGKPPIGLTENLSPTFLSSGNPCLDFFFHVVPDTPSEDLIGKLQLAWEHNSLTALKLICNLRGVRGSGKSDKEGFYTAAIWLHGNHPKTLASNLRAFAEFGYFKDFLEILYRILEGSQVRKIEKEERKRKSSGKFRSNKKQKNGSGKKIVKTGEELKKIVKTGEELKEEARVLRKKRESEKAEKALGKYKDDANYRFLHDRISDFFAEMLKSDVGNLSSGKLREISLAAKWCPTIDSSYDKSTLICENIAKKLFPREIYSEYNGIDETGYTSRVRDRLRKEVLVPLHKALELPEVFMSSNNWDSLPYNRVASIAMKNYKKHFLKHTPEKFKEFLENVKSGKAKIAAGALLPHEIISQLNEENGSDVAELQWKRMVDDLAKKGKLNNCLSIYDVSGSMDGTPMDVSVALGILVSELSDEPWKGKLITFSEEPELQTVEGETLAEKTEFVRHMNWGMNTNFQKVFDRILEVAVKENVSEEQMIKRLFVFSDMEFDQASENPWETDYEVIKKKFDENGFKNVPEIVFWNLSHSGSTPVVANQKGVGLVSGFSKNILSVFLEGGGVVNPVEVMEMAIAGDEYKKLTVFD